MISLYGVKHYYIQKDEPIVLLVIGNDAISCMQPVQKILRTLLASNTPEAFDTDIAKVRVAVVVQHVTWQVEEIVKILVTIAYSPSWVRAESRLVWVAGDGIAVLKILQQN